MPEDINTLPVGKVTANMRLSPDAHAIPVSSSPAKGKTRDKGKQGAMSKKSLAAMQSLEQQCRQLAMQHFFHETSPVRSIGLTSSIEGEGKSFLSIVMARTIAEISPVPVTLLECNWQHPTLHEYYGLPATPGLAEWLRGECNEAAIRHRIHQKLTVIPAGEGRQDALGLLQQLRHQGLVDALTIADELFIVDLPAQLTSHYGVAAASIVDALFVVVRAGVTPESMIRQTCTQLADLPLQGMVLNQAQSRVPRWLRQLL